MAETRSIIDKTDGLWDHGHREELRDGNWVRLYRSEFMKLRASFWFQKRPVDIMREDMGFETTPERANEFERASDNDPGIWYYLGLASKDHGFLQEPSDEPLKWIMGALAAEINTRGLRFTDIPKLLPAHYLSWFSYAILAGEIDRTFTKAIFAELLKLPHLPLGDPEAGLMFNSLITRPEFKALSVDDLEPIIDKIIADNPEQFEKAKANPKLVQFFIGQTMKATQGKAPPPTVSEIINRKLNA